MKWDAKYRDKHGIDSAPARELPPGAEAQLDRLSRRIYRALGLTGYARMDFRMRADGSVFALEANANPHLAEDEDFAQSAAAGRAQTIAELLRHDRQAGARLSGAMAGAVWSLSETCCCSSWCCRGLRRATRTANARRGQRSTNWWRMLPGSYDNLAQSRARRRPFRRCGW